jgi:PAS domain S-box-containing protein
MESREAWKTTGDLNVEHGKGDPFAAAIRATRMPMLITDPRRADNPVIFANDAFLALTGYSRAEVTGRNCRFLQGPATDRASIGRLSKAVANREDIQVDLLNYRKDGTSFWNALYMSPVLNERNEAVYFFASQVDITDRIEGRRRVEAEVASRTQALSVVLAQRERANEELQEALTAQRLLVHEVDHRVKNNLQMIASLLIMQSRNIADPEIRASLTSMLERVEALSAVQRRLYQSRDVTRFDLTGFSRELATDLVRAANRDDVKLEFDLDPLEVPAEKAAPIALMMNELVTNALKHGFAGERPGRLALSLKRVNGHCVIRVDDDGVGMARAGESRGAFGKTLVESLGRQMRASTHWLSRNPGTRVEITLPVAQEESLHGAPVGAT